MSILAQCGYGRGNKIDLALSEGVIQGVIMSPLDERKARLEQAIQIWGGTQTNTLVMFDPQFYVSTMNNPRERYLCEYDYYNNNKNLGSKHFSRTRIQDYVQECIDYQHQTFGSNIAYIISPTIIFDSFRDSWSQIALNMAVASVDYHSRLSSPQPLLISLVVSETAFQTLDAVLEFLDALTEIDAHGFYIIIRRNSETVQNSMESTSFGLFMYFCHVLAMINEYEVIVGYSDWHSFLLKLTGVTHTASGWHQKLRQFSLARLQPSSGARRRPRKRYSSVPLLSSPLINPELQDIYLANLLSRVLSGSNHDAILINGPVTGEDNWSDEISCIAHWYSLNTLSQLLLAQPSQSDRIQEAERLIHNALTLYSQLKSQNIFFDQMTGPNHILEWQDSLQEFCALAGL